jgi:hypothetical protein
VPLDTASYGQLSYIDHDIPFLIIEPVELLVLLVITDCCDKGPTRCTLVP